MSDKKITYKIEITKIESWEEPVPKNLLTSRKPTDKKDKYEGTLFEEQFAVSEVMETKTQEKVILQQRLDDLDLTAVIKAVNGIDL